MKVSAAGITFFFLITIALGDGEFKTEFSSGGPYQPTECCFAYTTHRIPRQRIVAYYGTNGQCSKPGIVFVTKRGKSICANPNDQWVQDYIKGMEEN
ncbi:C-C motif chemokine 14 isoform X2 [Saimiri boliviensis]|uniref:C-C motif chemokine 14 isoform X2 n=1 Tax=Saimiri boliviensis TaxID=27679 RepID=UPI00193EABDD|nr:C-C motif chemokine 14 [Saimiri boliviensis boliviensis]